MEAMSKECIVLSRLNREDCKHPKHDSIVSEWKVLIGPSNWEDHANGKQGAERYMLHNLPNCSSPCSGLYEFGILVPRAHSGRKAGKLDADVIIPVYIGQADNVRTRLQHYGRNGDHFENGSGLFTGIFTRGCSLVYRWAPRKSKRDAEKTETRLLNTYDYAWNKSNNGVRRRNDILQKLDRSTSGNTQFLAIAWKLPGPNQKKIGVKTDTCKPLLLENRCNIYTNLEKNDLLSRIRKIGRSQPRLVPLRFGFNEDCASICGVAIGDGPVCTSPPVEGRKRCAEHKGVKVNGFASKKLITDGKSLFDDMVKPPHLLADNCPITNDYFPIGGVNLNDGSVCREQPVQGRKRCEEQKGKKITGPLISESVTKGKQRYAHGPVIESHKSHGSERSIIKTKLDTICGVDFEDGSFCTSRPMAGRKRCEDHKWMRANRSNLSVTSIPSVFDSSFGNASSRSVPYKSYVKEYCSSTCGAPTANGSPCRNLPAQGRERCWQHKGRRAAF